MEFGKAFSFPFEDQDWIKKVGIAALVMLIPIVGGIAVAGWGFEVTRRVIRRDPQPLPDWSDFVTYLVNGLKVVVVGLAYALPIILVSACSQGIFYAAGQGGDDTMMSIATVVMICFSCLMILYGIFMGLVMPAALGNFAATDQLGAAFRFGEVFGLVRAAPGPYVLVLLGAFLAGIIAMLGSIACGIGALLTSAYAMAINGHLQGQAYNEASALRGAKAEF